MTIEEMITKIEELQESMLTEMGLELTDYAREQAYYCLVGAVEFLKENEER